MRFRAPVVLLALLALIGATAIATASSRSPQRQTLRLVPVVSNLDQPVHVTAPRNEPGRLYVVEKTGRIRLVVNGRLRAKPFLDLSRVVSNGGEQGLLSIAFHPRYAQNRKFYVNYTDTAGDTRVVEYRSNPSRTAGVPATRRQVVFVGQPYPNHNGGQVAFGPDGALYVGMGDGGSGGDPENRAQNPASPLGKLLRVNVDSRPPRVGRVARGLRNPWRFSFDRTTGDLYLGDVGQGAWEEIDYVPRRLLGQLANFGWRVYEGRARFTSETPTGGRLVSPIAVLSNPPHCSVVGGFVYRGTAVPAARGRYFYGDYCDNRVRSLKVSGGRATSVRVESFAVRGLSSFGEDARGELYLTSLQGRLYRLGR